MDSEFAKKLALALSKPLPGRTAHLEMGVTGHHGIRTPPENVNKAGVMALFIPGAGISPEIVFIKRSSRYHDDRHKGQIGFPGGREEPEDHNILNTALRETREEIGVDPAKIHVVGKLSELYIPVSNFLVHPFVGILRSRPEFVLQETEVDEVLCCPLDNLLSSSRKKTTRIKISEGISLENVPYFDLNGNVLWGATAMMMAELLSIIQSEGVPLSLP